MRTITILTLLIFSSGRLLSQSWTHRIDSLLEKSINKHNIKGLSVGIVFDNQIQYSKGYGKLNDKSNNLINAETPFLAASISKTFVATAIIQLQEKKLLDINEKVIQYIPEYTMKDTRYKSITIKHLLNHTSGLPEGGAYVWGKNKNKGLDIKNCALSLSKKELLFQPGERFNYSNIGYVVLGYIIEKITEKEFNSYIKEDILNPLEMTGSSFDMNDFECSFFPDYHNKKGKKQVCCVTNTSPSGNLITTSTDLCKWMLYNLCLYHGLPIDAPLINKESQISLWTPTQTFEGSKTTLGLGWWQYHSEKYGTSVFHAGHYTNYSVSNLVMFPEKNFGFVILCNDESAKEVVHNELSNGITEILTNVIKTK